MMKKRGWRGYVLVVSLSLVFASALLSYRGLAQAATATAETEIELVVDPNPTPGLDFETKLDELLHVIVSAEGPSDQAKRQLQERVHRLSDKMARTASVEDDGDALIARLEAVKEEEPELAVLVDAIIASYKGGSSSDTVVQLLLQLELDPEAEPEDPALQALLEVIANSDVSMEDRHALVGAIEAEPHAELSHGQIVSSLAHVRNFGRKAEKDGVELTPELITEFVIEGYAGQFDEDALAAIVEITLSSDRGMSEAVHLVKAAAAKQPDNAPDDDSKDANPKASTGAAAGSKTKGK